jgi:type II secretion system protein J
MQLEAPARNRKPGFTLIEVLLAVAVFAIVLGAINSVFFGALRLRNKTVEAFETALPLEQALAILRKDFEGILLPGGRLSGEFTTTPTGLQTSPGFVGERVTPDIHTAVGPVHELARWSDVEKVAYFLAIPTNNASASAGKELIRQVTRNLLPVNYEEPELQWLMSGLHALRLQYYDGMSWTETWDSATSTNLPRAVKVQITLAEDQRSGLRAPAPIELVVPILVEGPVDSATSGGGAG